MYIYSVTKEQVFSAVKIHHYCFSEQSILVKLVFLTVKIENALCLWSAKMAFNNFLEGALKVFIEVCVNDGVQKRV